MRMHYGECCTTAITLQRKRTCPAAPGRGRGTDPFTSAPVKGFGCRPIATAWAGTGAGVRKPPGKEPASLGAGRRRERYGDLWVAAGSDRPDINIALVPPVQVTLHDYRNIQVPLGANLTLEAHGPTLRTEPTGEGAWAAEIRRMLREVAERSITAAMYYLDREALNGRLAEELSVLVAQHGRRVRSLEAQALSPLPFKLAQAVRVELPWQGATKRSVTFQIEANLQLAPNMLGPFMSVHASPEAWLKRHLEIELPMLLSGKEFVDLDVTAIEETRRNLHDKLQRIGAPDGIAVQMFIAEPALPPVITERKLTFTVPKAPPYTCRSAI
jgi:hypothetical protein